MQRYTTTKKSIKVLFLTGGRIYFCAGQFDKKKNFYFFFRKKKILAKKNNAKKQ